MENDLGLHSFGLPSPGDVNATDFLLRCVDGLEVRRAAVARSRRPFPASTDLESALKPALSSEGFQHHVQLRHPKTGQGFEYDFWRPSDGIAMEIMGYRADDEVYKDILKFHVHEGTRVGVVWVPRWKWLGDRRTSTNFTATLKALAFADSFMAVEALLAVAYDWESVVDGKWALRLS